jgi:hypothetical protein
MTAVVPVLLRWLAVVVGGYAASAGLVALASAGLPGPTGLPRADATVLATSLGFLVYLVLALWIAAERRLWRAVAVPAAIAGIAFALARLVALPA